MLNSKKAKFMAEVSQYRDRAKEYVILQQANKKNDDVNIIDEEGLKEAIPDIKDEDLKKYVIQDNEFKYRPENVKDKEEEWLKELGILAMSAVFTITFISKGTKFTTIQATKVTFPSVNPTSDGEIFSGWYYDAETTNSAVRGSDLESDITLYAKWTQNVIYKATFKANGGTYAEIQGNKLKFPGNIPGTSFGKFKGWYYDSDATKEAKEGDVLTKDTTIYAGWTLVSYGGDKTDSDKGIGYTEDGINPQYPSDIDTSIGVKFGWYREEGTILYLIIPEEAIKTELVEISGELNEYIISLDKEKLLIKNFHPGMKLSGNVLIKVTYQDETTQLIENKFNNHYVYCLAEGTEITLANKIKKKIEDITYEDNLLVWDFDNGCFGEAKPLWIKKRQASTEYNYIKFENGLELKTVADHRIFNVESQRFTYTMNEEDTPIGTTTFLEDGTTTKLVERKVVKENVNYYNIITNYHMNLFANGILTSLRLNNLYKIENMKFVKDDRKLRNKNEFIGIQTNYVEGLRLLEQPEEINQGNDVKHTNTLREYVERILKMAK